MRIIGLTGGIGSGKSTVSALLARFGVEIIDADAITHELQRPGQPVLQAMVDEFGTKILKDDGSLDREQMAAIAFGDPAALQKLNAIVHPAVSATIAQHLEDLADTDAPVILDVPLLVEAGRGDLSELIVVDTAPETAIKRLVSQRGFTEADVRARIDSQIPREQRLSAATIVIDNNGTLNDLERAVEGLYRKLKIETSR